MQFFVRSAHYHTVIDYFVLNFTLAVGETQVNQIINGAFFRSDVTFTVTLNLTCPAHFYSADCSIYCRPANSSDMGHYTCLSDGSRQCLPGYLNETTDCLTPCTPADGCHTQTASISTPSQAVILQPTSLPMLTTFHTQSQITARSAQLPTTSTQIPFISTQPPTFLSPFPTSSPSSKGFPYILCILH